MEVQSKQKKKCCVCMVVERRRPSTCYYLLAFKDNETKAVEVPAKTFMLPTISTFGVLSLDSPTDSMDISWNHIIILHSYIVFSTALPKP